MRSSTWFSVIAGTLSASALALMAVAVTAMNQRAKLASPDALLPVPDFVRVFKDMGVNAVHLAEFHGDGHFNDPGPIRLNEMKTMFDLCRTYSDDRLLLIPGEEGSQYMGEPWPPAPSTRRPSHPVGPSGANAPSTAARCTTEH